MLLALGAGRRSLTDQRACFEMLLIPSVEFVFCYRKVVGRNLLTLLHCVFSARFNHKLDELQACRQEIGQILDQKLAKQGLSVVSCSN